VIHVTDTDLRTVQSKSGPVRERGVLMAADNRNLTEVLWSELEFLNRGDYRKTSWRPRFVFEDSPTCLNGDNTEDRRPCSECILMQLVPEERRKEKVPCRYIHLNKEGGTIDFLYRTGTQQELESTLRTWLTSTIEKLEREPPQEQAAGPFTRKECAR